MADDSLDLLNCSPAGITQPRPPDDVLGAFYSVAQSLLPGLNLPYNVGAPLHNSQATSSNNYDLKLPGGVQIPKMDDKSATDMMSFLQPLMNAVIMGMAILGPVKVIIDIVIAIINVLCAIPDPLKIASALSTLMLALVPLLGLFPATAGLQVLLETAKSVIMILTSILMQILPKIDLVIENVKNAIAQLSGNNTAGADGSVAKICVVLQTLLDDLAVLAPINKILDLISSFMGLSVAGICSSSSDCCDDCPPIVRTPPSGIASIVTIDSEQNLSTIKLDSAVWTANEVGARPVGGISIGSQIDLARPIDIVLSAFGQLPSATNSDPLGTKLIDLAIFAPNMFESTFDFGTAKIRPVTVSASSGRATIITETEHSLSVNSVVRITNSTISSLNGRYKIISLTDKSFSFEFDEILSQSSIRNTVIKEAFKVNSASLKLTANTISDYYCEVVISGLVPSRFASGDYQMFALEDRIISAELMTNGCKSEVSNSRDQFEFERDVDFSTSIVTNNGGLLPPGAGYQSAPNVLLGIDIPRIDEEGIKQIIVDFAANPIDTSRNAVFDKLNLEIDKFKDLARRAACLLASSLNSTLASSKVVADFTDDPITITYQPRTRDNQPLLVGIPSNVEVNAIFSTTFGVLGETQFDSSTGTYSTTLSATSAGNAEIKAYFVTSDVCSTPRDSSTNGQKTLSIQFLDGTAKPRRAGRNYIQSEGGRRR